MILIFSTNTNCESMAYRSFRPSGFEARGVRKVTQYHSGSFKARCATEASLWSANYSKPTQGNAPELRESLKAHRYQAWGANSQVAASLLRVWSQGDGMHQ